MTIPQNPYIAGNSVGGTGAFIGRADVLREVTWMLLNPHRNAIGLYGQRRIGKTSLLQESKRRLAQEGKYFPVYMDLQDKAAWPLAKLLRALAQEISAALHTEATLPESGDIPTAFRETYIPQVLAELPAEAAIVLLLDEFDVLDNPEQGQAGTDFFPYLRTFLEAKEGRLQFVFVIGRKPEDLSTLTRSVFKGIRSKRVSLLSKEDTWALVRLAERNHTLAWSAEALQAVWELTHGHPYLTQQLCEIVWENAHEASEGDTPPAVRVEDVHAAVPETLESSASALQWLWDGLPAAEKYVAAVLAEAGPQPVNQEELLRRLNESGVLIVIHELQNAPQILKDWDLLEETPEGYRFRVELLRRWIAEKKPVSQVYQQLENIEPLAQGLYETGRRYYQSGQLDRAVDQLRQALEINPNHTRAGLLLAQILLTQGEVDEAVDWLEKIYAYYPGMARPHLVQALLKQAEATKDKKARLKRYMRVLEISPGQWEAVVGLQATLDALKARAEYAAQTGNLKGALALYRQGGFETEAEEIAQRMRKRVRVKTILAEARRLEEEKQYAQGLVLYRQLVREYPEEGEWNEDIARLEEKQQLAAYHARVQEAIAANNLEEAQKWLRRIVNLEPENKQVLEDLIEVVRRRKRALHRLSPWNPLDALRLLWWLLVSPRMLKIYQYLWGEETKVKKVGKWLASFLTWAPWLIVALAVALQALPLPSGAPPIRFYWIFAGIFGLAMLLSGIFGANDGENVFGDAYIDIAIVVVIVVTFVMAFGVAFDVAGSVTGGVTFGVGGIVAGVMAFFVAGVVAVVVAGVVAGNVAIAMAIDAVFFMAGFVAIGAVGSMETIDMSGMTFDVVGIVAFVVAGVVASVVALFVAGVVDDSIQTGKPYWLPRLVFGALVAAYAFLIWFSFLGGWRFFQVTGG